jgi:glycosyltransferase involved in cell wall biosynthesis
MKKILYLSQLFPHPPDSGGKIKTLNTVLTLAKQYQVYAIFISEEKPRAKDVKVLTDAGIQVKIFYSSTILASVKDDLWGLFGNFLRGIPHYVFQYTHPPAGKFIQQTIKQFQPDIIHVDHLNMAQYLPQEKQQKWILEHHNVETYLYWTRFVNTTKPTRKLYLLIEMVLTYFFEKKTLPKFDFIFAISEPEKKRVEKIFGVKRVAAQPLVYPALPIKKINSKNPYILFVGTLGWPPNEDAVGWFVHKMLPIIEKAVPNVEFHVVGRSHLPFEKTLPKRKNIILHGYQADLTPFLARADVFVLPFRMGGGLRLKSLTALAAGLPLVSTSLGVEGLKLLKNKHYLHAETTEEFANQVIRVLVSKKLAKKLGLSTQPYLKKYHDNDQNRLFLKKYSNIIKT